MNGLGPDAYLLNALDRIACPIARISELLPGISTAPSLAPPLKACSQGSTLKRVFRRRIADDGLGADTYVRAPAATMRPALIAAKKPFQSFSVWFP